MRKIFVMLFAATVIAGCGPTANLDAITKFGKLAADAQTVSDTMAGALYTDCVTAREYGQIATLGSAPGVPGADLASDPLTGTVPPVPTPAPSRSPQPSSSPTISPTPAATPHPSPPPALHTPPPNDADCVYDLETSRRWKAFNDGIFAYVKGLGAVAGVSVAPSAAKFKAAGEGLVKLGVLHNDKTADAAGTFVADIGNAVLSHEQDRDLQDLIQRSRQDDIFARMIAAAQTADLGYYYVVSADKSIVDTYFRTIITSEKLAMQQVLKSAGEEGALDLPCVKDCAKHVRLVAQAVAMRDRIATQRERWATIDAQMLTDLNRVQPYYATMGDIGRANDALITAPKPGLAGAVQALEPLIEGLGDDVGALIDAKTPTPAPKPAATK